jgi:plastocyanin
MRRTAGLAVAATLLAVGLAACGDDDGEAAAPDPTVAPPVSEVAAEVAEPQVVDVAVPGGDGGEFAFETDLATIAAGPVEVRLANGGALEHQAAIFRFRDGEDFASFAAAAAGGDAAAALALVEGYGGPNAVAPGATGSSTQVVVPGEYALLCVIPDANGVPHAAQGMVRPFTVTEAEDPEASTELAEPDVEVELVDLAFVTPTELDAGATVRATNAGEQVHEIVTYRLEDGRSLTDVLDAVAAGAPPPMVPAGGLGLVAPGVSADFTLPDEPGDYVFLCFVPDATTPGGPPHLVRGMAAPITVS